MESRYSSVPARRSQAEVNETVCRGEFKREKRQIMSRCHDILLKRRSRSFNLRQARYVRGDLHRIGNLELKQADGRKAGRYYTACTNSLVWSVK